MPVEDLLLETLEDLDSDDFDTFKWRLTHRVLEDCTPIPKARLDNAKRTDTVSTLMEYYMEKAVNVTIEVLKKMKNNLAAEKLRSKYAERNPESSSALASSSAGAPSPSISARGQSVIIFPTVVNSTTGAINIVNKTQ